MLDRVRDSLFLLLAYCITYPLRALAPLMVSVFVVYTACSVWYVEHVWLRSGLHLCLFFAAAIESAFLVWFRLSLRGKQRRRLVAEAQAMTPDARATLFRHCRDSNHLDTPFAFLDGWFSPVPLHSIGRDDIKRWLAWAFFDQTLAEALSDDHGDELEMMVREVEEKRNVRFSPGSRKAPLLLLNFDPVDAQHRPLVYYLATQIMDKISDFSLFMKGFRRVRARALSAWIRMGVEGAEPIVFVHGVGMGLSTYFPFLHSLASNTTRTLVLLELSHVSMKLAPEVATMHDITEATQTILQEHCGGAKTALWVAHSLGTFVVSAVNRLRPELIHNMLLIDPVCLLLWEPVLVRNFCYRKPETPMQLIQHYHISRELFISHYFHRHFLWHECVLFAHQIPSKARVFVSRKDNLCNPQRIIEYLEAHRIEVRCFDGLGHGGWIIDQRARDTVIDSIRSLHLIHS